MARLVNLLLGSTLNDRLENWTLVQEEFSRSYRTQSDLQGLEILDVFITQDQGIEIPVKIRRFNPQPGDTTSWRWRDSTSRERVMEMPPFYICDVEGAGRNMRDAVAGQKAEYINYLLGDANPILRKTFEAAFRYLEVSTVCPPFPSTSMLLFLITSPVEQLGIGLLDILGRHTVHREAMAHLLRNPPRLRATLRSHVPLQRNHTRYPYHGHADRRPGDKDLP